MLLGQGALLHSVFFWFVPGTSCFLISLLSLLCCRMALPALSLLCLSLIFSYYKLKMSYNRKGSRKRLSKFNEEQERGIFIQWVWDFSATELNGAILEESCSSLLNSYTRLKQVKMECLVINCLRAFGWITWTCSSGFFFSF